MVSLEYCPWTVTTRSAPSAVTLSMFETRCRLRPKPLLPLATVKLGYGLLIAAEVVDNFELERGAIVTGTAQFYSNAQAGRGCRRCNVWVRRGEPPLRLCALDDQEWPCSTLCTQGTHTPVYLCMFRTSEWSDWHSTADRDRLFSQNGCEMPAYMVRTRFQGVSEAATAVLTLVWRYEILTFENTWVVVAAPCSVSSCRATRRSNSQLTYRASTPSRSCTACSTASRK